MAIAHLHQADPSAVALLMLEELVFLPWARLFLLPRSLPLRVFLARAASPRPSMASIQVPTSERRESGLDSHWIIRWNVWRSTLIPPFLG